MTALKVLQYDYPSTADSDTVQGVPQPWPAADSFPIRTLHLNHMCGPLPRPALLPHLRELQVHLWVGSIRGKHQAQVQSTFQVRCASIAPFLTQLESLSVMLTGGNIQGMWPWVIGTAVSTSLTHFATDASDPSQALTLLITHAPRLQQVSCRLGSLAAAVSGKMWGVERFVFHSAWVTAGDLAALPAAPAGLTVLAPEHTTLELDFFVKDIQVRATHPF